jgi:hypothetical protein
MVELLGRVISPLQGLYLHRTTQHRKTRTNIHALSGIRTHGPSNQPAKTHASDRTATVTGYPTCITRNDAAEWLAFKLRIQEARVQISGWKPAILTCFSWFPSVLPGRYWDSAFIYAMTTSFHILPNSFISLSIIWHYIIWATDSIIK